MAPQLSPSTTTQIRNGRRSVAVARRRALVAALGLAVLAAVAPVTAAHPARAAPASGPARLPWRPRQPDRQP